MTSVLDRPAPPPDLTLRYGPLPEHVVDLRLPPAVPGRAAPLIVLIHGGFWRPAYDRTHLGPMSHALAAAGYMVAVPEYRRAGNLGACLRHAPVRYRHRGHRQPGHSAADRMSR